MAHLDTEPDDNQLGDLDSDAKRAANVKENHLETLVSLRAPVHIKKFSSSPPGGHRLRARRHPIVRCNYVHSTMFIKNSVIVSRMDV